MFGIILISAVTLAHLYMIFRACSVPFIRRRMKKETILVVGALAWLVFAAGRVYGHDHATSFAAWLELAGMTWMGFLLLTSLSLFAVDIVTGFGFILPKIAPSLRGAAFLAGLLLSLAAMVQGTRQPVVENYEVEMRGLPRSLDGMVIVGLSDLHLGPLLDGTWLKGRVDQVKAERPDMIVLLGDIFEGHGRPAKELVSGLKDLAAPMGVWAVLGNHEFHGGDDGIAEVFREAGIDLLRNERVTVRPGLELAGVDDLTSNYHSGSKSDLVTRTLSRGSRGTTILLSHTPWDEDRAAKAGADLMLCGHTHGGQIWPFGLLVRPIYPLLAGRYDVDGMTVIVTRGAGTWGPRMRLWKQGEIIRVTLRAGKKHA